jgi:hypothetical protein
MKGIEQGVGIRGPKGVENPATRAYHFQQKPNKRREGLKCRVARLLIPLEMKIGKLWTFDVKEVTAVVSG